MRFTAPNGEAIKSQPMNIHYGRGQRTKIVTVADATSSLNDTYLDLEFASPTESNKDARRAVYIWFNVGGAGTDPNLSGKTGVEVTIAVDDTAATVAAAIKTALEAADLAELRECWIENSNELFVWGKFFGKCTDAVDGASATGFTITVEVAGRGGFMGGTQDGVEFNPEVETEDILIDQGGSSPVASIFKGLKVTASTSIVELTPERIEQLYGTTIGEAFEPEAGKKFVGFGTNKIGTNITKYADELILHPVAKDWDDYSENLHLWKATLIPSGTNYGSETTKAQVTWTAYIDSEKVKKANIGGFGDGFAKGLRA